MARSKTSVTIQDVAAAAGVSVSTVSRVLNHKRDVANETAERVARIIEELGYSSSLAAKSLRSQSTDVVGLIVPDLDHSYSLQILRGVSKAVTSAGFDLIVYTSGNQADRTRAAWEQQQIALLNGTITAGMIVVTPYAHTFRTGNPIVAIDPQSGGVEFPAVISTNRVGVMAAMDYLLGLGHRRIGYIGGRPELQSSQRRLRGYYDSLLAAGLTVDPALIQSGDYTEPLGYACAQQLLALPDRPSAIFAANDMMAFGVMAAARAMGLTLPDELSVVGFDNIPEAAAAEPALTTVDQALEPMGQLAAQIVLRLINGETLGETLHKVPTGLVIRNSCRAWSPPLLARVA